MNTYYEPYWTCGNEIEHHGVLGMRWGIRRYQNKDGSLTSAGKKRYIKQKEKLDSYKERQVHKVNKSISNKYDKVVKMLQNDPKNVVLLTEKRQIENYLKAEKKEISKLTIKDMNKERLKNGALVVGGLLGVASGVGAVSYGAAATMASTAFGPQAIASAAMIPIGWLGGAGGGLMAIGSAINLKDRSPFTKSLKKGNEWIIGSSEMLGYERIADINKKLRKQFGSETVDAAIASQVNKVFAEETANRMAIDIHRRMNEDFQRQIMQDMNRQMNDQIINQINTQIQNELNNQIAQQVAMQANQMMLMNQYPI